MRNILLKRGVWVHSEQGPTQTIVDAGGAGRVFDCLAQQEMTTLDGFRIRRGHADGEYMYDRTGGGLRIRDSRLTLRNCER